MLLTAVLGRAVHDLNYINVRERHFVMSAINWFLGEPGRVSYSNVVIELDLSERRESVIRQMVKQALYYIKCSTDEQKLFLNVQERERFAIQHRHLVAYIPTKRVRTID